MGSHYWKLDAGFTASNSHDRSVWPTLNRAGSHSPGAAAERTAEESCASLTQFQVWIQPKICTWNGERRRTGPPVVPCDCAQCEPSLKDMFIFKKKKCVFILIFLKKKKPGKNCTHNQQISGVKQGSCRLSVTHWQEESINYPECSTAPW